MRPFPFLAVLSMLLVGCSQQSQLGEPFLLNVGQEINLEGVGMTITLVEILPEDEEQAPRARVSVFYAWSTEEITLVDHAFVESFRIELLELDEAAESVSLLVTEP